MPTPSILVINAKTIGLSKYKAGQKVWVVSLDPKHGRPFTEGKIIEDTLKHHHFYKVQLTMKNGLSKTTTSLGLKLLLGEMVITDGLTREDERVVTNAVHEARLLHLSLSAMEAVAIGKTAFTAYPVGGGEDAVLRPGSPHGDYLSDSEMKVADLINRCNQRTTSPTQPQAATSTRQVTIQLNELIELQSKVQTAVRGALAARQRMEEDPDLRAFLRPDTATIPPLYQDFLGLPTMKTLTFTLPTLPETRQFDTPLTMVENIGIIEDNWEKEYGIEIQTVWTRMRTCGEYSLERLGRIMGIEHSLRSAEEEESESQEEEDDDRKLTGNQTPRMIQFPSNRNDESSMDESSVLHQQSTLLQPTTAIPAGNLKPPPAASLPMSPPATVQHQQPPMQQPAPTQTRTIPEHLICSAIQQMELTVPSNGYLEPFPTVQNLDVIARRIRGTTFGQICAVPGANVATTTGPPREALKYDHEYVIAYALHLLNTCAFTMAHQTSLNYHATTGVRKNVDWFAVKSSELPHVVNGYYTASSLMHAAIGRVNINTTVQQDKLMALLTTLTNCGIGVTDGTFLHRCAYSMDIETVTKMFCGRAPTEEAWGMASAIIQEGKFGKQSQKNLKGKPPKGVLPILIKYWLPHYDHTQHLVFPSDTPYTEEQLVAVPSESEQIRRYREERARRLRTKKASPSQSRFTLREVAVRNEQDASVSYAPSIGTTTWATRQSEIRQADIKTFMTPTKIATTQPAEIIEINTSDSVPVIQQQTPERAAPPVTTTTATTTVQPTILPELEKEVVDEGKDGISEMNLEIRTDDTETVPEPEEDAIVQHAGQETDNIEPAVVLTETVLPQPATPQQNIDQTLIDTPAPMEREAAEALGVLALTRRERSVRESETRVRRSTPTTSPPTMTKRRKITRRRYN
jgi:hypothetical protein